jgi:hypothetical protein
MGKGRRYRVCQNLYFASFGEDMRDDSVDPCLIQHHPFVQVHNPILKNRTRKVLWCSLRAYSIQVRLRSMPRGKPDYGRRRTSRRAALA